MALHTIKGETNMTMTTEPEDKLSHAKAQGQAQFDSIVEMVTELNAADTARAVACERDAEQRWEIAERTISEDALSVEVRGDWVEPSNRYSKDREVSATEYRILLCTGGPAVRIIGELSGYCEPETARLEVQDWGTPWTEFYPKLTTSFGTPYEETLLTYARCFWFGE